MSNDWCSLDHVLFQWTRYMGQWQRSTALRMKRIASCSNTLGRISTIFITCVLAATLLVTLLNLRMFVVSSVSMDTTLVAGDYVVGIGTNSLLRKFGICKRKPMRGDIVITRAPGEGANLIVKRVTAVSGDHVRIEAGHLILNGKRLDEPYARFMRDPQSGSNGNWLLDRLQQVDLTVPPGHYFLLGDNRDESRDSRAWGPIAADDVLALVIFRIRATHISRIESANHSSVR
jgi:signal peptidase I